TDAPSGQGQPSGSFPSGHATRALFLALVASSQTRPGSRGRAERSGRRGALTAALVVGGFLLAALVGYSALYFGYHWPSDVLGGYLLAVIAWQLAAGPGSLPSWLGRRGAWGKRF